jgi:hypothetical protein
MVVWDEEYDGIWKGTGSQSNWETYSIDVIILSE